MEGKTGASIEETEMIEGLLIDKDISHPQMAKEIKDAKICILTFGGGMIFCRRWIN